MIIWKSSWKLCTKNSGYWLEINHLKAIPLLDILKKLVRNHSKESTCVHKNLLTAVDRITQSLGTWKSTYFGSCEGHWWPEAVPRGCGGTEGYLPLVIFSQTLELEDTSRPDFSLWLMTQSINDRYVINIWQSFFTLNPLWKIPSPEIF